MLVTFGNESSKISGNSGKTGMMILHPAFLLLISFLILILYSPVCGEENPGKVETFTFTSEAKIIKGSCIKSDGKTWIDGNLVKKIFEASGAEASFDSDTELLALGNVPADPSIIKLPAAKGEPFTIVINGVILKTSHIRRGSDVFIPVEAVKTIMESAGKKVTFDNSSNLAAISAGSPVIMPLSAPAEKPVSVETPTVSPKPALLKGKEKKEAVVSYLNSLKKILEDSKPGEAEKKKFGSMEPGKDVISSEDMNAVVEKQKKMLEEIKKLNPPEEETGEIHQLAISISAKMIRVMELASRLLSLPDTRANPDAEKEMAMLLKQLTEEEKLFNEKVGNVKKKYGLGNGK